MSCQILILGSGYLGRRLAHMWRDSGADVVVTTRDTEKCSRLRAEGLRAITCDLQNPGSLAGLPPCDALVIAIAPDRHAAVDRVSFAETSMMNLGEALDLGRAHAIYISSTGVYGQIDGQWVDEASVCQPDREGGRACLAAETWLTAHVTCPLTILRLGGIYGPGRVPYLSSLQSGSPLALVQSGYLNLIHVDDAVRAIVRARELPDPATPRVLNVTDGHPVVRRAYYDAIARHLGVAPQYTSPDLTDPRSMRAQSNKRVSNQLAMERLGWAPQYPSYREGLAAILGRTDES